MDRRLSCIVGSRKIGWVRDGSRILVFFYVFGFFFDVFLLIVFLGGYIV